MSAKMHKPLQSVEACIQMTKPELKTFTFPPLPKPILPMPEMPPELLEAVPEESSISCRNLFQQLLSFSSARHYERRHPNSDERVADDSQHGMPSAAVHDRGHLHAYDGTALVRRGKNGKKTKYTCAGRANSHEKSTRKTHARRRRRRIRLA